MDLLERVCTLFEASEDQLPRLLAEALHAKHLPPFLTALIHQRRLLWYPLEFDGLLKYRTALRFLNATRRDPPKDEDASRALEVAVKKHVKELQTGIKALYPAPPKRLADRPPKMETPTVAVKSKNPAERLDELDKQAGELRARLDSDWKRLAEIEAVHNQGPLDAKALADLAAVAAAVEAARIACADALNDINELRTSGALIGQDQVGRVDRIERAYKGEATRPGKFRKKLDKLPVPRATPTQPGETTSTTAGEKPQAASAPSTPMPLTIGDDTLTGLAALERALEDTDKELIRFFNAANATLQPYSSKSMRLPALHSLRGLVRARAAEVLYRLGRRRLARRLWNSLLCHDRLDVTLLKNIAVCDTRDPDASRCLASWRSYVEMLYFYDIVEGSPRPRAAARAEFHREFSHVYAPALLQAKPDAKRDTKVDDAAFAVFLDSPGRLRHFVGHKLLEYLNAKLDFRSPLLLGVSKSDGDKARARARDALVTFAEQACALLPDRVRDAFTATCLRHIDASAKACASARRLTPEKDPHYAREEPRHVQWLKEVVRFKKTIYLLVRSNESLRRHLHTLDFLDQFALFDRVPIGQSLDLLNAAALDNGLQDGEMVLGLMQNLADNFLVPLLEFVFSDKTPGPRRRPATWLAFSLVARNKTAPSCSPRRKTRRQRRC